MSKWTELLAAAKDVLESLEDGNPADRHYDALMRLGVAVAACEAAYDPSQDTHAATWSCSSHPYCSFAVTITGSEAFVTGPQAKIEVIQGFAQHFGDEAFRLARWYADAKPAIGRIQ